MMPTLEIIEDDSAMRTLLSEWLAAEGYRVRARADVPEAAVAGVALVIVDLLDLPGRGAETLRQVRERYAGAVLVGVSTQLGRALGAESAQARALGLARLVPKPCSRVELLAAVAGALAGVP